MPYLNHQKYYPAMVIEPIALILGHSQSGHGCSDTLSNKVKLSLLALTNCLTKWDSLKCLPTPGLLPSVKIVDTVQYKLK